MKERIRQIISNFFRVQLEELGDDQELEALGIGADQLEGMLWVMMKELSFSPDAEAALELPYALIVGDVITWTLVALGICNGKSIDELIPEEALRRNPMMWRWTGLVEGGLEDLSQEEVDAALYPDAEDEQWEMDHLRDY